MKRIYLSLSLLVIMSSCVQNAITGRKQFQFFPEAEVQSMAVQQYRQFLTENKVVVNGANKDAAMVKRVGERIAKAITAYYSEKNLSKELDGYQWEYNLVDSKEVNAWCMPGGKIVVYTGLLPYTQNESALAVVMGHEVAHALARHGNERMSQAAAQQLGNVALSVAIANKTPEAQQLFLYAYGIGTTVGGILPYSRKHELEADRLGLTYAALAGYDPQTAIPLWERMEKASTGTKPPEILSTHPSESSRIEQLKKLMPEALTYYNKAKQ